jgi:hypothetical protein
VNQFIESHKPLCHVALEIQAVATLLAAGKFLLSLSVQQGTVAKSIK